MTKKEDPKARSRWNRTYRDKRANDPARESSYRTITKNWRAENKSHMKTWQKLDRIAKVERLDEMKGERGCTTCGEKHPGCLDFHHRADTEKVAAVATMVGSHGWSSILREIEKCDVICSNCHRKLHWEEKRRQREEKIPLLTASIKTGFERQTNSRLPTLTLQHTTKKD